LEETGEDSFHETIRFFGGRTIVLRGSFEPYWLRVGDKSSKRHVAARS
jgi:hypothetical protein